MRRAREVVALLVCLLLAGLLSLVAPDGPPQELAVAPDRDGTAEAREYGAQVTAVRAGTRATQDYGPDVMTSREVLVMVHYRLWSHTYSGKVEAWVQGADGRRWQAIDQVGSPKAGYERSGVAVIEVPRDALGGATFVLQAPRTTDPVTLHSSLRFPLPPQLRVGDEVLTRPERGEESVHRG